MANGLGIPMSGMLDNNSSYMTDAASSVAKQGLGSRIMKGLSGFMAGPIPGVLGILGSGLKGWLNSRAQKRKEKAYQEQLKEDRMRWQKSHELQQKRFGLDSKALSAKLKQQQVDNDNYFEERNYERGTASADSFNELLSGQGAQNELMKIWG